MSHTAQGSCEGSIKTPLAPSTDVGPIQTLDGIGHHVANLGKLRHEVGPHKGHRCKQANHKHKDKDDLGEAFALFGNELGNLDRKDRAAKDEGEGGEDDDEAHVFYSMGLLGLSSGQVNPSDLIGVAPMTIGEVETDLVGFHIIDGDFPNTLAVLVTGMVGQGQPDHLDTLRRTGSPCTPIDDFRAELDGGRSDGCEVHGFYSKACWGLSRGQ